MPDGFLALAAVLGQQVDDILVAGLHLLQPPGLPGGCVCQPVQLVKLSDASGDVPQDVVFDLLPQLYDGVGQRVEIVGG